MGMRNSGGLFKMLLTMAERRGSVPSLVNVTHKFSASNRSVSWFTLVSHLAEIVAGPVDERVATMADRSWQSTF